MIYQLLLSLFTALSGFWLLQSISNNHFVNKSGVILFTCLFLWLLILFLFNEVDLVLIKFLFFPITVLFLSKNIGYLKLLAILMLVISISNMVYFGISKISYFDITAIASLCLLANDKLSKNYWIFLIFFIAILQSYLLSQRTFMVFSFVFLLFLIVRKTFFIPRHAILLSLIFITTILMIIGFSFTKFDLFVSPTASNLGRSIMPYAIFEYYYSGNFLPLNKFEALSLVEDAWPKSLGRLYFFSHVDTHNGLANLLMFGGVPLVTLFILWAKDIFAIPSQNHMQVGFLMIAALFISLFSFETFSNRSFLQFMMLISTMKILKRDCNV